MLNFNRTMTSEELTREKQKDYRNIVVIQIIIAVTGFSLAEVLFQEPSLARNLTITLLSGFSAVYAFLLWDLLRNFTNNQVLIRGILGLLTVIVVFGTMVEFPFYQILEFENKQVPLLIIHGLLFPVEITIISFALRDLFSGKYISSDKLWGAACVYLMIAISFGSLYDLINIMRPGSLGADLPLGLPGYLECLYYSFNILGGLDTVYNDPTRLVRNLGVVEAVWGNLFVVLIIGKLLTMPRKPE